MDNWERIALKEPKIRERFFSKINKTKSCWLWKARSLRSGYGRFSIGYKDIYAHRISYVFAHGGIPKGKWILHKCDNRLCVNPDHLYAGNHADNMRDAVERGRMASGDRQVMRRFPELLRKLTNKQANEVREKRKEGHKAKDLAANYGVSTSTIYGICRGSTYKERFD